MDAYLKEEPINHVVLCSWRNNSLSHRCTSAICKSWWSNFAWHVSIWIEFSWSLFIIITLIVWYFIPWIRLWFWSVWLATWFVISTIICLFFTNRHEHNLFIISRCFFSNRLGLLIFLICSCLIKFKNICLWIFEVVTGAFFLSKSRFFNCDFVLWSRCLFIKINNWYTRLRLIHIWPNV